MPYFLYPKPVYFSHYSEAKPCCLAHTEGELAKERGVDVGILPEAGFAAKNG
jgi:hypothetical protein